MIVLALIETSNMYQFLKFAGEHFQLWQLTGADPVELGSTFIDSFQIWLRTNYPSNEGNNLRNNEKEGTVRYRCCKNMPALVVTSHEKGDATVGDGYHVQKHNLQS
jgi:adenosine/AMP kinase